MYLFYEPPQPARAKAIAQRVASFLTEQGFATTTLTTLPFRLRLGRVRGPTPSATAPLAFTVSDAETAAGSLTVSGSSSNPTLIPNANIVFGGSGTNRSVTVGPAANQSGTATITITISDGSASTSESFLLTVIPATTSKYLYLPFEAESAVLAANSLPRSDPPAWVNTGRPCGERFASTTSTCVKRQLPGLVSK